MKDIEIPFGAFDSELQGFTYTIPEGYTAEIKDGKVIIKKEENEDEKIMDESRQLAKKCIKELMKKTPPFVNKEGLSSWLEYAYLEGYKAAQEKYTQLI